VSSEKRENISTIDLIQSNETFMSKFADSIHLYALTEILKQYTIIFRNN